MNPIASQPRALRSRQASPEAPQQQPVQQAVPPPPRTAAEPASRFELVAARTSPRIAGVGRPVPPAPTGRPTTNERAEGIKSIIDAADKKPAEIVAEMIPLPNIPDAAGIRAITEGGAAQMEARLPPEHRSRRDAPTVVGHPRLQLDSPNVLEQGAQIRGRSITDSVNAGNEGQFKINRSTDYRDVRPELQKDFPNAKPEELRHAFDLAYEDAFRANRGHFTRPDTQRVYERAKEYLSGRRPTRTGTPEPIEAWKAPNAAEHAFFFTRRR